MKKILVPVLVLIAACLMESCSSGKQAFEKGNYDEAVIKAISRLRKSPNNKKASQTLRESYPLTISWHRDNVQQAKLSNDEFKWERVVQEYQQVNYIYNELKRCPACMRLVATPVHYVSELNDAKNQAAAVRYQKGEELLARARSSHDRYEAREAYLHFEVASNLLGDYKDSRDKMAEAKFLATLKVVVEPIPVHSRNLQLSNEFFENKILEFLETMPVNEFVRFYSFQEAQNIGLKEPDQVIQLQFDDFVLGQLYLKEKEVQVSKDSVVLAIIKAQNTVPGSQITAANLSGDDRINPFKYYAPAAPALASPVLVTDPFYLLGKDDKVTICHKIPASLGVTNTITVSQNALQHHLDHGDVQGPCSGDEDPQQVEKENENSSTNSGQGDNNTTTAGQGSSSQTSTTNGNTQGSQTTSTTNGGTQSTGTVSTHGTGTTSTTQGSGNDGGSVSNQQEEVTPTTRKVYGTVKATVHVFHKALSSRGIMDFKIIDVHSQRVLTQEKMPGEFVWYTEWGYFNGDERALDDYFLEMVELKEAHPPAPQDLFVAFTQPIYRQITYKIKDFYRNY